MFDLLKKKFSNFIDSVTKKEKEEEKEEQDAIKPGIVQPQQKIEEESAKQISNERLKSEILHKEIEIKKDKETAIKKTENENAKKSEAESNLEQIDAAKNNRNKTEDIEINAEHIKKTEINAEQIKDKKLAHSAMHPDISLSTKLKGIIFKSVEIKENDVSELLDEFKLSLLQSDVNYEVAERVVNDMHDKLVGSKIQSKDIQANITNIVRNSLINILAKNSQIDIVVEAKKRKEANELPFKLLFIGPNGAGKTTTIGKIASLLMQNGLSCVFSASDTFRAAAIEQTSYHGKALGVHVVKGAYGSDPASIAFDAIAFAKAKSIDVVLIDSAGRQETNKNLIEEIKKIVRVTKPDMKIFVGEAISGNSLINQVKAFDEAIKIDGIILTKLDCDAKGGNTISILSETKIPILFFGTGEKYTQLISYDPELIIESIIPEQNN
jgi:fused signal recognition particle receptor